MRDRPFDETVIELLRKDPEFAVELLAVALKENTPAELAITLRHLHGAGYRLTVEPRAVAANPATAVKDAGKANPIRRVGADAAKHSPAVTPSKRLPASRGRALTPAAAIA